LSQDNQGLRPLQLRSKTTISSFWVILGIFVIVTKSWQIYLANILIQIYPVAGFLDHIVDKFLISWRTVAVLIYIPANSVQESFVFHIFASIYNFLPFWLQSF
jgi:hypothetical protein